MTTTTSYSSKKIIFASYKNALKRLKGIGLFYSALSVVFFPVMYFLQVTADQKNTERIERNGKVIYELTLGIYPNLIGLIYFTLLVGMTVFAGVVVNNYMHNKKAVDVYHSLPVTRTQGLVANYLAAATVIILPMIVCFMMVAIGNLSVQATTFTTILFEILKLTVAILAMLSITFCCCVSCCAMFDGAAFALSLGVIVPCFYVLKEITFEGMLFGYSYNSSVISVIRFSPVAMFYNSFIDTLASSDTFTLFTPEVYAAYIIFALAVLALACYIYTQRKSELAQSFNTSGIIYRLITIASSFGCAVVLAIITFTLTGNGNGLEENKGMIIIFSFIYGALFYFAFNSILTRSFKQTVKSIITLGISAAAPAIYLALLFFTGWFGYVDYIPATEQIKQVTISYVGTYGNILYYDKNMNTEYSQQHTDTIMTSESGIKAVSDVHKNMVEEHKKNDAADGRGRWAYINIRYTLANGKTVVRRYNDEINKQMEENLLGLENAQEFKSQHSPFQLSGAENVKTFEIKDGFGQNFATLNLTKQEIEKLYNAMKLDDANQTLESMTGAVGMPYCKISVIYKSISNNDPVHPMDVPMFSNVSVDVMNQHYNTIQALKDLKLDKYTKIEIPENVKAIVTMRTEDNRVYTGPNSMLWDAGRFNQYPYAVSVIDGIISYSQKERSYTKEKLAEILPTVQNYANQNNGTVLQVLFVDSSLDTTMRLEEVSDSSLALGYYLLPYANAPQFLKDDFAKEAWEDTTSDSTITALA